MPWNGHSWMRGWVTEPVRTVGETVDKKHPGSENLKPWKPGESGNGKGRPPVPEDVKRIRKLTNDEIKEVGSLLLSGKQSELEALLKSDDTPMLKKWIASVAIAGVNAGDEKKLDAILNRIVGKVKEEIDVNVIPRPVILEKHDGTEVIMTTARDVKEIEK